MSLLLFHPGAAKIDCGDCQKRLYNLETGELVTYKAGAAGLKHYDIDKAPCQNGEKCPKESPEKAHLHQLTDRNWRTLNIYRRGRVTGYRSQPLDPLLEENLAIVDGLFRSWERQRSAEAGGTSLALQLIPFMQKR